MKFQCINGWTKEKMKQQIKDKNTGLSYYPDLRQCRYRQDNGNACFVGVFISDENYHSDMDSWGSQTGAGYIIERYNLGSQMPLEIEGMTRLQQAHDFLADPVVGNPGITKEELHSLAFDWIDKNVID